MRPWVLVACIILPGCVSLEEPPPLPGTNDEPLFICARVVAGSHIDCENAVEAAWQEAKQPTDRYWTCRDQTTIGDITWESWELYEPNYTRQAAHNSGIRLQGPDDSGILLEIEVYERRATLLDPAPEWRGPVMSEFIAFESPGFIELGRSHADEVRIEANAAVISTVGPPPYSFQNVQYLRIDDAELGPAYLTRFSVNDAFHYYLPQQWGLEGLKFFTYHRTEPLEFWHVADGPTHFEMTLDRLGNQCTTQT